MQRAITNLIDNALKYGRRADVFLTADSKKAKIIIDDFGNKETAESLSELTAPFRRGDNSKNIKGMGIGLAIVFNCGAAWRKFNFRSMGKGN